MLTWTIRNREGIHTFKIYENDREAELCNIIPKSLEEAYPGDYVRTDNGYFIPVTYRTSFKQRSRPHLYVVIHFPNLRYKNTLYADSGRFRYKTFTWSRQPSGKSVKQKEYITSNDKLFALYLSEGMSLDTAFKVIYKKDLPTRKKNRVIGRMLDNPNFIKYLKEKHIVQTLKQKLGDNKVTDDFFIKLLKKILEDKKEPVQLRLRILDTFGSILLREEGLINQLADRTSELPASPTIQLRTKFLNADNTDIEVVDENIIQE